MPRTALTLFGVFVALALGLRGAVHWWHTGSFGVRVPTARQAWVEALIGGGFVLASLVIGVIAPLLQLVQLVTPLVDVDRESRVYAVGLVCFLIGLAGVLLSQFWMGASWRVGVDPTERTRLVTTGPFALVRNPIFTFTLLASLGLTLLSPNWVALLGFAALLLTVEVQVRLVEEPYLRRVHGLSYAAWAARAGRFLPGAGRLTV